MKELVVCTLVLWTSTGISLDGWLIFAFQSTYVTPPSRPYVDCSDAGTNTLKKVDHNHEHITLEHNHNSKVFVDLAGHQSLFLRFNFTADRQVSLGCHKGSAGPTCWVNRRHTTMAMMATNLIKSSKSSLFDRFDGLCTLAFGAHGVGALAFFCHLLAIDDRHGVTTSARLRRVFRSTSSHYRRSSIASIQHPHA